MAERRMFAKTIIESDAFLDMPLSAQALYFHLSMRGDDDGFINNPRRIQQMIGSSEDDMKILCMKRFIITFDSGVIVIRHWKIHNYIRQDRYRPTLCKEEKRELTEKSVAAYNEGTMNEDDLKLLGIPLVDQMTTSGIPLVDQRYTQYSNKVNNKVNNKSNIVIRVGEEGCRERGEQTAIFEKNEKNAENVEKPVENSKTTKNANKKRKMPPTLEEVEAYCKERNNYIDAEYFYDYYNAKDWMIGDQKMANWKSAIRAWERNNYKFNNAPYECKDPIDIESFFENT